MRLRWVGLLVAAIAVTGAYPASTRLTIDRSIASMFAPDDPSLQAYQRLQAAFGGNAVAMIVYRDESLMSPEGLARSALITERVGDVAGVRGVLSPARINEALGKITPGGLPDGSSAEVPPLLRPDDPVAQQFLELFASYTHARDGRHAAVVAMLEPDHAPETIAALEQIADSLPEPTDHAALVGEPVLVHQGFALVERDGAKLVRWTLILLSVVLVISLRDLRFVLLSLAVIIGSSILTRATLVWLGLQLSLVSTILTAVITVVAVASVLHVGVRTQKYQRRGRSRYHATLVALSVLLAPIFWTCATDAAGFLSLRWSRILPVQQFGVMIAIAMVYVFVLLVMAVPGVTTFRPLGWAWPNVAWLKRAWLKRAWLKGAWPSGRRPHRLSRRIHKLCLRLAAATVARRRFALAATAIVALVSVFGMLQMETETSFLNNFRPRSPIVAAYARVEKELGGAGVWDVVLEAPSPLTADYLDEVRALEARLREVEVGGARLTKVLSLADVEAIVSEVPLLALAPPSMRLAGMRTTLPVFHDALLTPAAAEGPRRLRIMLRSRERLPAETKTALIARVEQIVAEQTASPAWRNALGERSGGDGVTEQRQPPRAEVTGYYVMMARLVAQLVGDQWRCFSVAIALVWILLVIATRSLRLATAALVPNLLPIFVVLAVSGAAGGKLNMGAAMIAAVSIGLSIDGSVHFLASYARHRGHGHRRDASAVHAAGRVGLPILLATAALVIGFSVLATSEFIPTATFGILVAATMATASVINLTVLPAAVAVLDRGP